MVPLFSGLDIASILDAGTPPHQPLDFGEQPMDVAIMIPNANDAIKIVGLYLFTRYFR